MRKERKKTPKILICCPALNLKGGVSSYYRKIKKYLTDTNISFIEIGGYQRKGINLFFSIIKEPYLFLKKIISYNPDIVLLNPSLKSRAIIRNMFFLLLSKLFNCKVIIFWRGFNLEIANKIKKNFFFLKIFVFIFNMADLTLVLSSEFREILRQIGINHLIITTTTVIDSFLLSNLRKEEKKEKDYKLVFMSRLEKEKGIYEAVKSFFILSKKYDNIEFHILGDGPEEEYVKKISLVNKNIKYHGYIDGKEKYEILKGCDIFVFPSYTEGMPNAVLEAMACGLVVITTPVGGLKDFFIPGKHGFFVKKHSYEQIVQSVEKIIKNKHLRKKIAQYNITYAKKNFSPEKRALFLLKICNLVHSGNIEKIKKDWFDNEN